MNISERKVFFLFPFPFLLLSLKRIPWLELLVKCYKHPKGPFYFYCAMLLLKTNKKKIEIIIPSLPLEKVLTLQESEALSVIAIPT